MRDRRYDVPATDRPEVVLLAFLVVAVLSTSVASAAVHSPERSRSLPAPASDSAPAADSAPVPIAAAAAPRPATSDCPAAPPVPAADTLVLSVQTATVAVRETPGGATLRTLANPTRDHQPLHLRVLETVNGWHRVQMPERPNSVTGWVREAGMTTSRASHRILIQRCSRQLTLFKGGKPVFTAPVAVGKANTPTPLGDFYVDFTEAWRPSSPYGPWLVSVTGFSDVYQTFGAGGVGQIGIHGTQAKTSVGKPTSNGCIRMHNDAVSRLAGLVVAGTPVLIVE